ncbi:MAG: acyl carrier protein [Chitinispirillaceae bacterium]|nr:acyl carrier protein [Chitinispirillaceae bacterium]
MTLEERVIAVIRENSEERCAVTLLADLQKDLGIDSFGRIMIINGIEDAFSITIDEKDLPAIRTVADIVAMLRTTYGINEQGGCSDRT